MLSRDEFAIPANQAGIKVINNFECDGLKEQHIYMVMRAFIVSTQCPRE